MFSLLGGEKDCRIAHNFIIIGSDILTDSLNPLISEPKEE
jgi:hypothetical protein